MTGAADAQDRANAANRGGTSLARADKTGLDRVAADLVRALEQRFEPEQGPAPIRSRTMNFLMDGGGQTITTGVKGWLGVDDPFYITGVELLADQVGQFTLDIARANFGDGTIAPTFASIIGSGTAPSTTFSARTYKDEDLLNWTSRQLLPDDILQFTVSTVTSATLVLVKVRLRPPN